MNVTKIAVVSQSRPLFSTCFSDKKCPACKNVIYHEKWNITAKVAEDRWAHKQAKQRELEEVVDFMADWWCSILNKVLISPYNRQFNANVQKFLARCLSTVPPDTQDSSPQQMWLLWLILFSQFLQEEQVKLLALIKITRTPSTKNISWLAITNVWRMS